MDPLSITDRLESTTPVRNPGPDDSQRGNSQQRKPKRHPTPAEPSDDDNASTDDQDPHEIDELA